MPGFFSSPGNQKSRDAGHFIITAQLQKMMTDVYCIQQKEKDKLEFLFLRTQLLQLFLLSLEKCNQGSEATNTSGSLHGGLKN